MRFVTGIRVTDFRSIANAAITNVGDITPLVGLNGSGKSNLLRALNLLFNGTVEGGSALNLRRDFREPGRAVKLRVVVEADLDYGVFASLRHELQDALQQLAGQEHVTVRKEWTLDAVTGEAITTVLANAVGVPPIPVPADRLWSVNRLLNAVRFRYIPNHVHPSQILGAEEDEIRRMLFDRLGKRQVIQAEVVQNIGAVAQELMRPIVEAMDVATGDVSGVELATPGDWRELAWAFGMKLKGSQTQSFDALLHGSGVQSVLASAVLHAIDTSFSGTFGWRKGAVWAIEEPESFLHVGLQEELARMLSQYAANDPIQILFSTHATPFLGVATEGLLSSMDSSGRTEFRRADRDELLRTAYTARIAPYTHALHSGPPKPMLLVEGRTDRELVLRAFAQGQVANPFDVRALQDLDPQLQGGDEVVRWLRYNAPALNARPTTSPVFVLRDWETDQATVNRIDGVINSHSTSKCIVWPSAATNSDFAETFVGIEKFLSTAFYEHAAQTLALPLVVPVAGHQQPWQYDINRQAYMGAKARMHADLAQRDNPDDIRPLIDTLPWLVSQLTAVPQFV